VSWLRKKGGKETTTKRAMTIPESDETNHTGGTKLLIWVISGKKGSTGGKPSTFKTRGACCLPGPCTSATFWDFLDESSKKKLVPKEEGKEDGIL